MAPTRRSLLLTAALSALAAAPAFSAGGSVAQGKSGAQFDFSFVDSEEVGVSVSIVADDVAALRNAATTGTAAGGATESAQSSSFEGAGVPGTEQTPTTAVTMSKAPAASIQTALAPTVAMTASPMAWPVSDSATGFIPSSSDAATTDSADNTALETYSYSSSTDGSTSSELHGLAPSDNEVPSSSNSDEDVEAGDSDSGGDDQVSIVPLASSSSSPTSDTTSASMGTTIAPQGSSSADAGSTVAVPTGSDMQTLSPTTTASSPTPSATASPTTAAPPTATATAAPPAVMTMTPATTETDSTPIATTAPVGTTAPAFTATTAPVVITTAPVATTIVAPVATTVTPIATTTAPSSPAASINTAGGDGASIATAAPDSSTFALVGSVACGQPAVDAVYSLYSNCRTLFDLCVTDSSFQIFPYNGTHATASQIEAMAQSDACAAVFTAVELANLTACTMSDLPLTSAVETLLKIRVDLKAASKAAPTAARFQEMMAWRYAVNLAEQAGEPCDSGSELYAQYEADLAQVLSATTIRVNDDYSVDVRLSNGSYVDIAVGYASLLGDGNSALVSAPGAPAAAASDTLTASSSDPASESGSDSAASDEANTKTSGVARAARQWMVQTAIVAIISAVLWR